MSDLTDNRACLSGKYLRGITALILIVVALIAMQPGAARAATAPSLGTAGSFAVLGGSTVTNTGPSTINGDLGVAPGNTAPGTQPGIVTGVIHLGDAVALQAQDDVTTAYNALRSQPCAPAQDLTGQDLGGKTLLPGVYCYSSSAQLTGTVTLDAQGDAGAVFIFKVASTLTTASDARVSLINGGSPCNVYWQVGSSATLGTTTAFVGNILALTSITLNTTASIAGRALARNGAVTLDTNTVTLGTCGASSPPAPSAAPPTTATTQPATTPTATPNTTQPTATPFIVPTSVSGPGRATATPTARPANTPTSTPVGAPGGQPEPEQEPEPAASTATPTPLPATATPTITSSPRRSTATPLATTPAPATGTTTPARGTATPTFVPSATATRPASPTTIAPALPVPNLPKTGAGGNTAPRLAGVMTLVSALLILPLLVVLARRQRR
jgi:type VI secretion system secreted protein VgrG